MQNQQPTRTPAQSEKLLDLGKRAKLLFHTPAEEAYADIQIGGRVETCPVNSRTFKDWLRLVYNKEHGGAPSNNAMKEAIDTLEALARLEGPEHPVFLRLGPHDDAIYLDMCDKARRVIEVTSTDWRTIPAEEAPVRFRRTPQMLERPLPDPVQGGAIDRLFDVLNIPDDDSRVLVKGFLLGLLHPTGPYPGLALYGEQGSAKSCTARYIRSVIDPTSAPVTGEPRDIETLSLQAHANWVPILDNVRTVREWLSDALCRLATGSAYNKRTHYENTDLTVVNTKRPFMLTSIADAIQQPDLINRVLTVRLPVIPKDARVTEDETDAAFAEVWPEVLGGLLDAAVMALRGYKSVQLEELPRMADLAKWVTAAEPAMDLKPGTFVQAYAANETDAYDAAINSNPVAQAVLRFMENQESWTGTPADLYTVLSAQVADQSGRKPQGWPSAPQWMSNRLNAAAPALRTRSIDVQRIRQGDDRGLLLQKLKDGHQDGEERTVRTVRTIIPTTFLKGGEEVIEKEKCREIPSVTSVASGDWGGTYEDDDEEVDWMAEIAF